MVNTHLNSKAIKSLPVPIERIILPLDYNYAMTGDLLVRVGDRVNKNQALTKALPNNNYCIALHAPINGTIINIGDYYVLQENYMDHSLKRTKAIEILADTNDINSDLDNSQINNNLENLDLQKTNLPLLLNQFGIIGLGGAGFPSGKKLEAHNISTLIVNAVECESPIIADHGLMINYSTQIISGIALLNKIIQADTIIIALKSSMHESIAALKIALTNYHDENPGTVKIGLKLIPDGYPNGYSKTLIKLVTNKQINYNQHSSQTGVICLNVGTVYAIEQALAHKQPLIDRIVTIGFNTKNKYLHENYLIPIGTPISTLLQAFEIDITKVERREYDLHIKVGGDYMGYTIFDSDEAPTKIRENLEYLENTGLEKTTQIITISYQQRTPKQLTVLDRIKALLQTDSNRLSECIKCGFCEPVCPMNLMPQQLYWFSQQAEQDNNFDLLQDHYISNCIECGLCDTACPSNLPLAAKFKHAKSKLKIINYKSAEANLAKARNEQNISRIQIKEEITYEQSNNIIKSTKTNKQNLLAAALKRAQEKKQPIAK